MHIYDFSVADGLAKTVYASQVGLPLRLITSCAASLAPGQQPLVELFCEAVRQVVVHGSVGDDECARSSLDELPSLAVAFPRFCGVQEGPRVSLAQVPHYASDIRWDEILPAPQEHLGPARVLVALHTVTAEVPGVVLARR
jgi:hypothetical protein